MKLSTQYPNLDSGNNIFTLSPKIFQLFTLSSDVFFVNPQFNYQKSGNLYFDSLAK